MPWQFVFLVYDYIQYKNLHKYSRYTYMNTPSTTYIYIYIYIPLSVFGEWACDSVSLKIIDKSFLLICMSTAVCPTRLKSFTIK